MEKLRCYRPLHLIKPPVWRLDQTPDQHTQQSMTHSHRSSSHRTISSSRRLAIEAEANAAAHMAELEALNEAALMEEELLHLEMAETV